MVADELQVPLPLVLLPADEALARGELPGAGAEAQQGDQVLAGEDEVAALTTGHGRVTEVMVAGDGLVPQPGVGRTGDLAQAERRQFMHRPDEQRLGIGSGGGETLESARGASFCGRQGKKAVGLHAQHGHPAGHVLQLPIRLEPVEQHADLARELRAVGTGMGLDQAAEGLQFVSGEVTPAIRLHELSRGSA